MTRIRMNTELRNKLFNKIKHTFENEDTQERNLFLEAREDVDRQYTMASELAKESMATLVMLLQKINVFILHTPKMLMMRVNKQKLNHTLILVYLVI